MTSVSHALIGAAIAAKIGDPAGAAVIGLLTHLVCDMVPHWDLGTNWRLRPRVVTGSLAIAETVVAMFGTYFIFSRFVPDQFILGIAIIFSLLPDWIEAPYYLLMPHPPKFFYYMYKWQSYLHSRLQAPWGVVTQVVVVGLFLYVGFVL